MPAVKMTSLYCMFLLAAVAAAQEAAPAPAHDAPAVDAPAAAADGTINTRAGPQQAGEGGQDLRFSPALIGGLLNAGTALLNSALGGGQNHGHGHHHGGFGGHPNGGFGGHPNGGFGGHSHGGFGGRPGGFGRRPVRFPGQSGFNQGGFSQGGFNQGGFNQGGFNHGGFNQGGFGQGGFNQFGNFQFGEKGGSCPPVRAECPLRSNLPPNPCNGDFSCPAADKCCFDTCLRHNVCKPPEPFHG